MEKRHINYTLLWERLREYASKAGRVSVRPMLLMYMVRKSPDTPRADKLLVFSTLSYLVLPIDIIDGKKIPVIGWLDEIASLAIAYKKVSKNITPAIEAEVDVILDRWFPVYTSYEMIEEEL